MPHTWAFHKIGQGEGLPLGLNLKYTVFLLNTYNVLSL